MSLVKIAAAKWREVAKRILSKDKNLPLSQIEDNFVKELGTYNTHGMRIPRSGSALSDLISNAQYNLGEKASILKNPKAADRHFSNFFKMKNDFRDQIGITKHPNSFTLKDALGER